MVRYNSQEEKETTGNTLTPVPHAVLQRRDGSVYKSGGGNKLVLRTTGIPTMSISGPDPTIISSKSIPARAKDVDTAGRIFLCLVAFSCGARSSSPR